MMRDGIGYEMYHYLPSYKPEGYQAFRAKRGRYVTRSPVFTTLREANDWIDARRKEDE